MDGSDPRRSVNKTIGLELLEWEPHSELRQMYFLKSSLQVSVSNGVLTVSGEMVKW